MNENVAFTICAKNYLAQAFTLKKSFEKFNPNCDFFIFLSDDTDEIADESDKFILLDDSWLQNWKQMAFKYNVIEFSTSIKPFCFKKLFNEGYKKVIYLDPDIYVTNELDVIYNYLDKKTIVLTPHYCNIQTEYTGSITEEEILFVGIYNLGFAAINNDLTGNKIINWWMNRLANKCYADKFDALHVDQKWMDFIPAFFPNDILITHHMGINPAIWNLHERELMIDENRNYKISNIESKELFPLLFFHFSGFDPFKPKLINRRHPKYNTDVYPSYIPLFESYIKDVYEAGYDKYSKLSYSFNSFENGENIIPLHRRLFRALEEDYQIEDPFKKDNNFFKILNKNKLLTGVKSNAFSTFTEVEKSRRGVLGRIIIKTFKIVKFCIGIKYYTSLISFLTGIVRLEKQTFLIKNNE
ncbi:hypothetical protein [[Flexibacter] sp. ATCC 35103]|uniref:hypothetical protein n=1 Tax=[Flexibacter] sp. ATCC 35103 TaxID=1937528 RepID=UPI0009CAA2BE|nr:hypothetical protein [[Flexibacter] sp. ATCC 35103]OMQ09847.1 hypothetical protein BXU01_15810 [[Flexibacter] sp. ATCC 35103]